MNVDSSRAHGQIPTTACAERFGRVRMPPPGPPRFCLLPPCPYFESAAACSGPDGRRGGCGPAAANPDLGPRRRVRCPPRKMRCASIECRRRRPDSPPASTDAGRRERDPGRRSTRRAAGAAWGPVQPDPRQAQRASPDLWRPSLPPQMGAAARRQSAFAASPRRPPRSGRSGRARPRGLRRPLQAPRQPVGPARRRAGLPGDVAWFIDVNHRFSAAGPGEHPAGGRQARGLVLGGRERNVGTARPAFAQPVCGAPALGSEVGLLRISRSFG